MRNRHIILGVVPQRVPCTFGGLFANRRLTTIFNGRYGRTMLGHHGRGKVTIFMGLFFIGIGTSITGVRDRDFIRFLNSSFGSYR